LSPRRGRTAGDDGHRRKRKSVGRSIRNSPKKLKLKRHSSSSGPAQSSSATACTIRGPPSPSSPSTSSGEKKLHVRSMERAPAQDQDGQKRRKKSQESVTQQDQAVQEDLRLKSTVGWQNAVKVLNAAYQHMDRPESQAFLDDAFHKIISIMLDQQ